MTTRQDTPSGGSGLIFMSQGRYLYSAMQTMSQYELELMQQWLQQMQNFAEAYGGWKSSTGPDGKEQFSVILNSDGGVQGGLVGSFLDEMDWAAHNAGEAYKDDARMAIVQAGVSAGSLIGTGAAYLKTSDSSIESQIKDTELMQKDLKENGGADLVQADANAPKTQDMEKTEKLIDSWATDRSSLRYTQKFGGVTAEDEAFNKQAIRHASVSKQEAIAKNLDKHLDTLQNRLGQYNNKFNSMTTTLNQVSQAGQGIGNSVFNFKKADHQQSAQMFQAQADVIKQVQPQETGFISSAQQKADQFAQDANSVAAAYGQIVSTHA